jgi:hypothetical protein
MTVGMKEGRTERVKEVRKEGRTEGRTDGIELYIMKEKRKERK